MTTANDWLMRSGARSARFAQVGDSITGVVFAEPELMEQRDLESGEVLRWPDGSPKHQIRVLLDTELCEDDEDDGVRALYIKGQMQNAVARAVRAAKARGLEVGGTLTVTYVGNGQPRQRGLSAPKLYTASYVPPSPNEGSSPVALVEAADGRRAEVTDQEVAVDEEIPF